MANKQKTQREMYDEIRNLLADNEEIVAFCTKKIEQLDAHKGKKTVRKADPLVVERRNTVKDFLVGAEKPLAVKDIAEALGYSSPQVTGALRGLVNEGTVEVVEPEQKSKAKLYHIVGVEQF